MTTKQLKSGLYRRLMHNVYSAPGVPVDHQLYARGAALLVPADGALGGRSAAAWYGAPFAATTDPVLVIVPRTSSWRGPRGVRVHRSSSELAGITTADDGAVRLTDPLRTAWDVAALERLPDAVALLDGMVRAGALEVGELARQHGASRGRWRSNRVGAVLPLVDGRAESPPESWVRVACVLGGLPSPVPQYVIVEDGDFLGRGDLAWPEQRLLVEYEGAYHFDGLQIARDDARYARLTAAGWRVIRVSAADLRDLDALVRRIARALAG